MENNLKGKKSVTWTFIAKDDDAVEAMKAWFEGHYSFMREKCHKEGKLKLISYYISEGPEYFGNSLPPSSNEDKQEFEKWFDGNYPKKTGNYIFILNEIYESEDGLHHHYIESAPFVESTYELFKNYNIEARQDNHMNILQSINY